MKETVTIFSFRSTVGWRRCDRYLHWLKIKSWFRGHGHILSLTFGQPSGTSRARRRPMDYNSGLPMNLHHQEDTFTTQHHIFSELNLLIFDRRSQVAVWVYWRPHINRWPKVKISSEKIPWEGEFTFRSDPWAGLIASWGSFYPMTHHNILSSPVHLLFDLRSTTLGLLLDWKKIPTVGEDVEQEKRENNGGNEEACVL